MRRYAEFILNRNPDGIWRNARADVGDWLAVDADKFDAETTPHALIGTAVLAHATKLLADMAEALGIHADAAHFRAKHLHTKTAFAKAFVQPSGIVGNGSQTSHVLALTHGLVPQHLRSRAIGHLVADIRRRGIALSTGILGTQYILDVLADAGHGDLAYQILLRSEYPSWGYMIASGATTIWESWNGRVWSGEGAKTMPNSYNHYMFGSVCGFLYRRFGGISPLEPGFKKFAVRPLVSASLRSGGADYHAIVGKISTRWHIVSERDLHLEISAPANTRARVHIPVSQTTCIEENGRPIERSKDLKIIERGENETVVEVGSGEYRFHARPSPCQATAGA